MESKKQHATRKKHIPWWLHLFIAILAYSTIKFFLPSLASDQAGREQFTEFGSQVAPIVAIVFLLLAANALYKNAPKSTSDKPDEHASDDTQ